MQKKIDNAKKLAKEDYETNMMKWFKVDATKYKRNWIEYTYEDKPNEIVYALEGTPDKAFVRVNFKTGKVSVIRRSGEVIKVFD